MYKHIYRVIDKHDNNTNSFLAIVFEFVPVKENTLCKQIFIYTHINLIYIYTCILK